MRIRKNYNLIIGGSITAIVCAVTIVGFFWTPYAPDAQDMLARMQAPSLLHLLGTDNLGRDIFSRVLTGAGNSIVIAAATVLIGLVFGLLIGGLTGYFGGWADAVLMRICDTVTSVPSVLLALVLIGIMGPGKTNVIVALGILFIPSFARITRGEVARCRALDYVQSARLMGVSHARIIFVHIQPNTMPVLLSTIAIGVNNAVLAEASLSYLGIGVQPPEASLGRMLSEAQGYLFIAPWYALGTGVFIVLLILGFGLLGEGLSRREGRR